MMPRIPLRRRAPAAARRTGHGAAVIAIAFAMLAPPVAASAQDAHDAHDARDAQGAREALGTHDAKDARHSPDAQSYAAYGIAPHMMDDAVTTHLDMRQLEFTHDRDASNGLHWDGDFWVGTDRDKLWLKSEGERTGGATAGKAEAYWSRAVSPFWDAQLGARRDFGAGPARTWLGLGIEGMAPYGIDTELTLYAGASGRTALALKARYDLPLTQQLVLAPEIEANAYGKSDADRRLGSGLSDATLSLRLRYTLTGAIAPYVGVSFGRRFGDTARYAELEGESRSTRAILAGVRVRF